MRNKPGKRLIWPALFFLPIAVAELLLGSSGMGISELLREVWEGGSAARRIVMYVRLPRMLTACAAGGALAVSGMIMQTILQNPLASPGVIGVNSGAGLMALAAMLLFPASAWAMPAMAFAGALLAALAVYGVSTWISPARSTVILAGVAVSSAMSAVVDALVSVFPSVAADRAFFSIGGFSSASMARLVPVMPFWVSGLLAAGLMQREMQILSLGDERALALGLRTGAYRFALIAVAALLAGCAVSLAGLLGFVGLIVPNLCRILVPDQPGARLPMALLLGAELCMVCDLAARLLFKPYELPVGAVLACLGAPFFLWVLYRQRRNLRASS